MKLGVRMPESFGENSSEIREDVILGLWASVVMPGTAAMLACSFSYFLGAPSLNQSFTNARRRASAATCLHMRMGMDSSPLSYTPGPAKRSTLARGFAVPGHYFHVVVEVLNDDLTLDS